MSDKIQKDYMGKISWSRLQCGAPLPMFGSDVKTDHPVVIRISKAYISKSLNDYKCDYDIFDENLPYIEVMLTPIQWAEFLTSGMTSGVPCTITKIDNKFTSPVESRNVAEDFKADINKSVGSIMESLEGTIQQIDDALDKGKTLNKTQLRELVKNLKYVGSSSRSNIEYIRTRLMEEMASIVAKAKSEVSAYAMEYIGTYKAKSLIGTVLDNQEVTENGNG